MRSPPVTVLLTAAALCFGLSSFRTEAAQSAAAHLEVIRLGLISSKPRARIAEHKDLIEYVGKKLAPDMRGEVVVASDVDQLVRLIQEKKVDFYMESAYPTFLVNERTGARILLRRWKGGVAEYSTLLFTKRGSGVTRLEELRGKLIAFEDPGSTSGYLLPKTFLMKRGYRLVEKSSFRDTVSPREIGYVFSQGSERNIVNWVLLGRVSAGVFNDIDFARLEAKRVAELSILAETDKLPRHLLSAHSDLDAALVQRLKEILLKSHEDEAGRKVLRRADKTSKFDPLPGGEETVRARIGELFRVLQKSKP